MAHIYKLVDDKKKTVYPMTIGEAVIVDGVVLSQKIKDIENNFKFN